LDGLGRGAGARQTLVGVVDQLDAEKDTRKQPLAERVREILANVAAGDA